MLVLEIKGIDDNQNKEKRRYQEGWIDMVNEDGRYGTWMLGCCVPSKKFEE